MVETSIEILKNHRTDQKNQAISQLRSNWIKEKKIKNLKDLELIIKNYVEFTGNEPLNQNKQNLADLV